MKKILMILSPLLALCLFGCPMSSDEPFVDPFFETQYEPVLVKRTELEKSVEMQAPKPIEKAGKIYTKDGFLFLNEPYKGVHIIDNRNPESPQQVGFIRILGSVDMAAKGNLLYVDNAVDLVTIDFTNPTQPKVVSRKVNVFPELTPPDLTYVPSQFSPENRPENTIIIGWE